MSFAEEMKAVSDELLSQFDERTDKIKLKVEGVSAFNPTTGEDEFSAPVEYDMTGVATTYNESLVNGTTIKSGDILLTVFCEVNPDQSNKVIMDGSEYSIVSVSPAAFTGIDKVINFKVQVRK